MNIDNFGLEWVKAVQASPGDSQTMAVQGFFFFQQRQIKLKPDFKLGTTNPNPYNFLGIFYSKKMCRELDVIFLVSAAKIISIDIR